MQSIEQRTLPAIDAEILIRRLAGQNKLLGEYMQGTRWSDADLGRICGMVEGYLAAFDAFPPGSTIQNIRLEVNHKLFGFVIQKYESYQAALHRIANLFLTKYPPIYPDDDEQETEAAS